MALCSALCCRKGEDMVSLCLARKEYLMVLVFILVVSRKVDALSMDGKQLLRFKSQVRDEVGRLSNWKESDDNPCWWAGVTCTPGLSKDSNLSGNVQYINLLSSYKGPTLIGTLQATLPILASLESLRGLDLARNNFSGPMPANFGVMMKNLSYLDLSSNPLTGSIPSGIGVLSSLQALALGSSELTGTIPDLQALSELQGLELSNNRLTGNIPKLEGLRNLMELNLSSNELAGTIPDLDSLVGMQHLSLSHNNLSGRIPDCTGLRSLTTLDLSGNQLVGDIPQGLWSNRSEMIDLSANRLTGGIPGELLQPSASMTTLNLSHNSLTGRIPEVGNYGLDGQMSVLNTLDLSNNQIDGPIPMWFSNRSMPLLRQLCLQQNNLSGDVSTQQFAGDLTELRLGHNNLTGAIALIRSSNFRNISVLDLGYNARPHSSGFGESGADEGTLHFIFQKYGSTLQELRLGATNLTGALPSGKALQLLHTLDLSNNKLEGEIPRAYNMTYMPLLRWLDLSNNQLQGQVPAGLTKLKKLTYLNLSNNNLTGPLPPLPEALQKPEWFAGNPGLCGVPLPPCDGSAPETAPWPGPSTRRKKGMTWIMIFAMVDVSMLACLATCCLVGWRWRIYSRRHVQDAELIAAMQDKDKATLMPLRNLQRATSNFSQDCQIGEGAFGTVYAGRLSDGTTVAVKKCKRTENDRGKDQFLNEVLILSKVNHRNLVRLLGCCLEKKAAVLVFEFVSNGTLREHLRGERGTGLSWPQRLQVALQTADALAYLHSAANPPIFHRDVKSSNILLDENLNAKVADFGISKLAPLEATHVSTIAVQGTPGYIDPQYYQTFQFTCKSDVYSFGVVLLELLSAQAPVDFRRGVEEASLVNMAIPLIVNREMPLILDPALSSTYQSASGKASISSVGKLAVHCLSSSPKDRPTMTEVVKELHRLWLQSAGIPDCLLDQDAGGPEIQASQDAFVTVHSHSLHASPVSSASLACASI